MNRRGFLGSLAGLFGGWLAAPAAAGGLLSATHVDTIRTAPVATPGGLLTVDGAGSVRWAKPDFDDSIRMEIQRLWDEHSKVLEQRALSAAGVRPADCLPPARPEG